MVACDLAMVKVLGSIPTSRSQESDLAEISVRKDDVKKEQGVCALSPWMPTLDGRLPEKLIIDNSVEVKTVLLSFN